MHQCLVSSLQSCWVIIIYIFHLNVGRSSKALWARDLPSDIKKVIDEKGREKESKEKEGNFLTKPSQNPSFFIKGYSSLFILTKSVKAQLIVSTPNHQSLLYICIYMHIYILCIYIYVFIYYYNKNDL